MPSIGKGFRPISLDGYDNKARFDIPHQYPGDSARSVARFRNLPTRRSWSGRTSYRAQTLCGFLLNIGRPCGGCSAGSGGTCLRSSRLFVLAGRKAFKRAAFSPWNGKIRNDCKRASGTVAAVFRHRDRDRGRWTPHGAGSAGTDLDRNGPSDGDDVRKRHGLCPFPPTGEQPWHGCPHLAPGASYRCLDEGGNACLRFCR